MLLHDIKNITLSILDSINLQKIDKKKVVIKPVQFGGNNKVFRIVTSARDFLLKLYFSHPDDKRDRLNTEFDFLSFLWSQGIRNIPEPIAKDIVKSAGLYEFINGEQIINDTNDNSNIISNSSKISKDNHGKDIDISYDYVIQAVNFAVKINKPKIRSAALNRNLFLASDACFSIKDHIMSVERRIERFKDITIDKGGITKDALSNNEINQKAKLFIENGITPAWEQIKAGIMIESEKLGIDINRILTWKERCLSPSDFGFHNAVITQKDNHEHKNKYNYEHNYERNHKYNHYSLDNSNSSKSLKFIDFEYAGWDDPAKMICDFFCQPKIPVPLKYCDLFIESLIEHSSPSNESCSKEFLQNNLLELKNRVKMLFPLFRIKWCCIMLNDFLTVGNDRRKFASTIVNKNNNAADEDDVKMKNSEYEYERKERQLSKAKAYFSSFISKNFGNSIFRVQSINCKDEQSYYER